jgi:hypothetical protein
MSPFLKKLFNPKFLAKKVAGLTYDAYCDWTFGGWCGGTKISPFAHLSAFATQSTQYLQLDIVFNPKWVSIAKDDVLVDVGCGKGRVVNYWLKNRHRNRIIGIELDKLIARRTRQRLRTYPNVTILTGDVVDLLPPDGTKFYLWNPFGAEVMRRFKSRLVETCGHRGNVTLIYYYSKEIHVFEGDPNWTIVRLNEEKDLTFPSAIIHMREPGDRVKVVTA